MDGNGRSVRSDLLTTLAQWLKNQTANVAIKVAYSGGRDSHVLLHALSQLRAQHPFLLSAIHINHGLQAISGDWSKHCHEICDAYSVPLTLIELNLTIPSGESLENIAREHRYAAFSQSLKENEILVTAHTEDDQAETFILQLLRGSGPQGLSGIAPFKSLGKGGLARPLLSISRTQIADYATANGLNWIEDPSNADLRFRRNFVRHEILSRLIDVDPGVQSAIARSSQHCANTQKLLEEYLIEDLSHCLGPTSNSLRLNVLKTYSRLKQEALFRLWLKNQGFLNPSSKRLATILDQMLQAKLDASPCVIWGHYQVKRHKDCLFLLELSSSHTLPILQDWVLKTPLVLSNRSVWQAKLVQGQGLSADKTSLQILSFQFRKGGERCKPQGQAHSSPLKKILQRLNVPSWERAELPLFYHQEKLVAVGDLFICEGWQADKSDEFGWLIERVN